MLTKILKKYQVTKKLIKSFKNWPIVLLDSYKFIKRPLLALGILKNKKVKKYRLKNGLDLFIRFNTTDFIFLKDILVDGFYDKYLDVVPAGGTIIDIGGHIGLFSIHSAQEIKGSKVYSYEPLEENYKIFEKNIQANSLNSIELFKMGVSDREGTQELFHDDNNTGGHTLYGGQGDSITIKLTTLEKIFSDNNISSCDFLKLDCEGAEYDILMKSSPEILSKISNFTLEYHPHGNGDIDSLTKYLVQCGFVNVERHEFEPIAYFSKTVKK